MDNTNALVSICLPVHNGEKYIKLAIDSLIKQDYLNYEIIIIDDFSSDKTPEICKVYFNKYKKIRFYQNNKRLGSTPNMVKTLHLSKGKYFVWASQDDIWEKDYLSLLVSSIIKKNGILSMCATQVIDINSNFMTKYEFKGKYNPENMTDFKMAQSILSPVYGKYLKTSIFIHGVIDLVKFKKAINIFPGYFYTERHLLIQLALAGKFLYTDRILFYKRIYSDTSRLDGDKHWDRHWYTNIRNFLQILYSIIFSPIIKPKMKIMAFPIILLYLEFRTKIFIVPKLKKALNKNIYNFLKKLYYKLKI